ACDRVVQRKELQRRTCRRGLGWMNRLSIRRPTPGRPLRRLSATAVLSMVLNLCCASQPLGQAPANSHRGASGPVSIRVQASPGTMQGSNLSERSAQTIQEALRIAQAECATGHDVRITMAPGIYRESLSVSGKRGGL